MEKPIVGYQGDPFVIRYYSPVTTIGGGTIIDANAPKQKRFKEEVLSELAMKEEGSIYDRILYELESKPEEMIALEELIKATGNSETEVTETINQLLEGNKVIEIRKKEYISTYGLQQINDKINLTLKNYHRLYPLRQGYPKEDMRSRLFKELNSKNFNLVLKYLEKEGNLVSKTKHILLPDHQPTPGDKEKEIIKRINNVMNEQLFTPPALEELRTMLKIDERGFPEIITYMVNEGHISKINQEMHFATPAIETGKEILNKYFEQEKELSLATARDLFNTTRKYALPLVEYYDRIRFTRRVGDIRVKM